MSTFNLLTFKMLAMTSCYAEKCCRLVSTHASSDWGPLLHADRYQFYYHSIAQLFLHPVAYRVITNLSNLCVVVARGKLNTPCLPDSVCSDNVLTCNTSSNRCQCKPGFSPQLNMCGTCDMWIQLKYFTQFTVVVNMKRLLHSVELYKVVVVGPLTQLY